MVNGDSHQYILHIPGRFVRIESRQSAYFIIIVERDKFEDELADVGQQDTSASVHTRSITEHIHGKAHYESHYHQERRRDTERHSKDKQDIRVGVNEPEKIQVIEHQNLQCQKDDKEESKSYDVLRISHCLSRLKINVHVPLFLLPAASAPSGGDPPRYRHHR